MIACVACATRGYAQTDTIRYVRTSGSYSNDGRSWASAKNNVQEAINDLHDYLKANNLHSGSVYVAEGTYYPTESTEALGGSILNTSFKIYEGIHVYGGFSESGLEQNPGERLMSNGKICRENWADPSGVGTVSGDEIASQWDLQYKTILSGSHSMSPVSFKYDSIRGRFATVFPANSYHVVWFATNGTYATSNDSVRDHFKPLEYPASLDGCVITDGNASSKSTLLREHTAYGGGVYMVGNSELRNCTVQRCNATLRGGGIYLDGGGKVDFCYIHTCQTPGIGVVQGYGGGVCIEYEGEIGHSHITNCAARCGGGLSICHIPSEYPVNRGISFYSPFATACVINNNTANAEGGGIYLVEGGTINHCTVTANNCTSADVTYYGRRHGRSGGIYIRDCGMIFNSVFWGNKCAANNDLQFASIRQVADTVGHEIFVYHSAFMNHDISDWTGAQKEVVFSLDKQNLPIKGSSANFPCFFDPTVNPNNWTESGKPGAGVFAHLTENQIPGPRIWHLTSYSALDQKGVQVTDAVQDASEWIRHAHTDYGVVTNPFEPVSTLGALVRKPDPITYSLIAPQGREGRMGGDPIPTIFIDPNRRGVFDAGDNFILQEKEGYSWDVPIRDLGEALQYFRQYLVDDASDNHHYMIPALDGEGKATGEPTRYEYVQILVKEGKVTTAGPGNYLDRDIRTAAMRVESHMRLYGGYPSSLSGTSTAGRNPHDYVTTITANVTGVSGERGYENNSAHVVAMVNVEHAIVDGFTLVDANTHNIRGSHSASAGGGVLVNNASKDASKRIHMTGNQLRNCVITNCTSPKGAAVYVNGEYKRADSTVCYAELKMVNCVVRNNLADYEDSHHHIDDHGIITANGRAYIEIEHCDIVNNVGFPFKADNKTTENNTNLSFHGFIRANNSIIFCNGDRPLDDRGNLGSTAKVMSVYPDGQAYVFGEYNMFDKDLRMQVDSSELCPRGFFDPAFTYSVPSDFLPSEVSLDWTFGATLLETLPSDKHNQAIFTRTDNTAPTYPGFVNPSRNVGNSTTGDRPLYGGIVSYEPLTSNPCVNMAENMGYTSAANYDRTDNCQRNRGGKPDVGAVENTELPVSGKVKYVRMPKDGGSNSNDGNSWQTAYATIDYALSQCTENSGMEIWVAAGKYQRQGNSTEDYIVLKSGVSLYGGFARTGSPSKKLKEGNRQIGNNELYDGTVDENNTKYQTIIDANGYGRVVSMTDNFPVETVVEGFTIQNCGNPKKITAEPIQLTIWKADIQTVREYSFDPAADGWESWDGSEEVEVEVPSTEPYDRSETLIGNYRDTPGAVKINEESAINPTNAPSWWTITTIPRNNRQSANSEATAYYYNANNANGKYYYYGTGQRGGTNSNYDWRTGNTYYRYQNYYRFQYALITYYGTRTRYYRDITDTVYVIDTSKGHNYYTVYNTRGIYSDYGKEFTNETFPREGKDYRDGGGCRMYGNGIIKSCLIWKNHLRTDGDITFAAGAAMLKGSRMESSIVRNNVVENTMFNAVTRGVGVHAAGATIINSLIVENVGLNGHGFQGVGLYISAKSDFYQCTIAYNYGITGNPSSSTSARQLRMYVVPGVWDDSDRTSTNPASSKICHFNNCIIWGNAAISKTCTNYAQHYVANKTADDNFIEQAGILSDRIGRSDLDLFNHCYHSVPRADHYTMATGEENVFNADTYTGDFSTGATRTTDATYNYANTKAFWDACQAQNLFNESLDGYKFDPFITTNDHVQTTNTNDAYNATAIIDRGTKNPYNINTASLLALYNVNAGDDNAPIHLEDEYGIKIDINGAARVQDCQVDKGAYEYNGAKDIQPDTITHPGKAIFYVTYEAAGGDASADSPGNAACRQKLQLVLDAAGRYKNMLMTASRYSTVAATPSAGAPDKGWTVEVWLEGDATNSTTSGDYAIWYTPTRSTKHDILTIDDNPVDYSFIIPHGIQVKGGFSKTFYHDDGGTIVDERDPLTYRSVLSGKITANTGAEGNCYHVVTFTNNIFGLDEYKIGNDTLASLSALANAEDHRAVLDGVFIEDGVANSPDLEDCYGAGAVVTDYAHIRNCVVQNNEALSYGGGLYLKPMALVSGTIVKRNKADMGGGVYIESPEGANDSIRGAISAHIYSTTICENQANTTAGGMWFSNTYARVNSTALWHNEANDFANVSGVFSRSENSKDYPFAYCAVESRRLEGQGNLELSPRETEGVRWDRQDPFNALQYYPIEMSSTLGRAGMTYVQYDSARVRYTTLDTLDIAGVSRISWTIPGIERGYAWGTDTLVTKRNDFIEIGARALNKTFEIKVNADYVMHRLYVMHTELLNSEAARALQDNTATDDLSNMYRQMGSCILNPFHRLSDAFEYIIAARKMNPAEYRNRVFEVFIEKGTYFPYHNAYGEQDEVRNSTFLVPEAIYVIGGVNSEAADHSYGQEGYYDLFTDYGIDAGNDQADAVVNGHTDKGDFSYTINYALLDSIRVRGDRHRPMRDVNLNSVIEPWEIDRQTILSGNAVSGEDFTHVYHVVTMHADSNFVGPQPYKFYRANPNYLKPGMPNSNKMFLLKDTIPFSKPDSFILECQESVLGRTTEFDGLQITGGYANHLNESDLSHVYATKTYYRGGGIFVDGNWTEDYEHGDALPTVVQKAKYNIPIIVENCFFTNNMAANGGAIYSNGGIYMFGCHFTQNYCQGPVTKLDQQYIPWTAGGCIATNATCNIANTLFDNNEAQRGLYPIPDDNRLLAAKIDNADARQGFGGVLSVADNARLRVVNCHFMKNKAVAYPSIYNFYPNNYYDNADAKQFAFNTIFWGNEVFEVDDLSQLDYEEAVPQASIDTFNIKYKGSRSGVFHYDPVEWQKYERLYHEYDSLYKVYSTPVSATDVPDTFNINVINKLDELRAQGNKLEGLYFCSYRKGYGPSAMKPTREGYLLKREEANANFIDPRKTPVRLAYNSFTRNNTERYDSLYYWVRGNNNVLINNINNATDGPNFRLPSLVAGKDGYMQNADWLLARINLTTDQGWGHLPQKVERSVSYYITKYTGTKQFETYEDAWAYIKDTVGANDHDIYPIKGLPSATFMDVAPTEMAIYNFYAKRYGTYTSPTNPPLPIADQYYMIYSRNTDEEDVVGSMDRISKNPRLGEKDVYIDVGIYEYQYVQLDIKGQEIDTMWVSTIDKSARHDGLTWETPTTDLQSAIDILMSSHNNHDKYICFLGDADQTFSPNKILDNRRTFLITSNSLAPMMPDSAMADFDYGVKSLTFLGGYSFDVKGAPRDPVANRTLIEMPNVGSQAQLNQLFVVEDMTRQMIQANYQGEYISRDSVVIPVVFDGLTFINPYSTQDNSEGGLMSQKGGAAIYYRWQRQYETSGGGGVPIPNMNYPLHPDSAEIDGHMTPLPKLTISNCVFMDNGARTAHLPSRSSAVRIDHGGGSSLIVNSLFHSNAGDPVYAPHYEHVTGENDLARTPNDVIVVNSTFALNDGHLTLKSDHSEVHNSLIWRDDLANDTAADVQLVQLELDGDQWDNTTNRDKPGIAGRMTNNAVWGCFRAGDETYHNDSLSSDNGDVYEGPNFTKPIVDAATSEQRRQREFTLNPGVRTMNMADTTVYRNKVFFRMYPDTCAETDGKYWRRSNGFKSVDIAALANDSDLASKPRLFGVGMERGAYECRVVLQRVVYVQPSLPASTAGDGSSWQSPFGQGQIQNALDVAALYTYMNRDADDPETRKSYVFVKGSYDAHDANSLVARDGVNIYGSLPGNFNDTAWINPDLQAFTNAECRRYVNYVRALSTGVASPNATPTRINSITMPDAAPYATGFLLDGFVISNPGETLTGSPVILNDPMATLRNCIVTDNTVSAAPVADVRRGLLYNSLLYNNTAETAVKLGASGLALNNTIVTMASTDTPIDMTDAAAEASVNNIAGHSSTLHCFAPYISDRNAFALPAYLTQNGALAYQLHERSAMIDAGTDDAALPALFDAYVADSTIAFRHDRDLLGNPRKLDSAVDMGAYETWRVAPNTVREITSITNPMLSSYVITTEATDPERRASFLRNYGGHLYPHAGSVVYLMDSSAMTMQYAEVDFQDLKNNTIIFRPGYMLLKSGASFYGNGHEVQMNYVAAEKRFINQRYSMTAYPFGYDAANIFSATYDNTTDLLTATLNPVPLNTYQYSGAARSAKDYAFRPENSSAWLPVDTTNRSATEGYLMDFGSTQQDTVLRFTSFAPAPGQYVYVENSDDKEIYLTQYDHRIAGTGETLNFTRQEDMGWNMKGLPWLVSNYRTDTILEEGNYLRQMYIPHVFYQMDGAGEYLHDGDQIYSSRSWDRGSKVAMGNAFFTQTATTKNKETVIFHLPYYALNERADRPIIRMVSSRPRHMPAANREIRSSAYSTSDYLIAMPDSTANKTVRYTYGKDAVKWISGNNQPQLYMLDNARSSRISLLGSAPTEVDIPLGVSIPATVTDTNTNTVTDTDTQSFTFSLPEREAFAEYEYVWLIDYKLNRFTNLLDEPYTADIEPGENNKRFAIRIGGFPKTDEKGKRQYVVYTYEGSLHVRGLVAGDRITVYSPSGQLVHQAISSGYEYSTPLILQNGYVVKVNDKAHKVLNI